MSKYCGNILPQCKAVVELILGLGCSFFIFKIRSEEKDTKTEVLVGENYIQFQMHLNTFSLSQI